jgi:type III restriction enzyme
MTLPTLMRAKFILARKLAELIAQTRKDAKRRCWQELLFGPQAKVRESTEYTFQYKPGDYPASSWYTGAWKFKKHYYPLPGDLESKGEEYDCANAIDSEKTVKHWVRNLSKKEHSSFWLQTSTDRTYPDFVAELNDGRLLVVEYKGDRDVTADDAKEKRKLGELWAAHSNGKALYLMAERVQDGRNIAEQIAAAVASPDTRLL